MLSMVKQWYKRRFSDPHAVSLVTIIIVSFIIIYFFGHLITPLLVAIVLAYLLEWPVAKLSQIGIPRVLSVVLVTILFISLMLMAVFGLAPVIWTQTANLINDLPSMFSGLRHLLSSLPEQYPDFIQPQSIDSLVDIIKEKVLIMGEKLVKGSLSSLISLVTLGVYLILVPLLIFFLLKDKKEMVATISAVLPKDRRLATRVWVEMNEQISNYIHGKAVEIIIVSIATFITFWLMDLRYSLLLSVMVGLSVLVPYIGAVVVTIPVAIVALFQWGLTPDFYWLILAHGIIQTLDGNIIVPVLFSEAVNLHPVAIIVSVLVFGGLWGFWGVFFAIPLATLVKAVWKALAATDELPVASES